MLEGYFIGILRNEWSVIYSHTKTLEEHSKYCVDGVCRSNGTCYNGQCEAHQRIFNHIKIKSNIHGEEVDVINVHMPLKREFQAQTAQTICTYVQHLNYSILCVCGDFNTHHEPRKFSLSQFDRFGFQDTMNWINVSTFGTNFSRRDDSINRLDYILIKHTIPISWSCEIKDWSHLRNGLRVSDHEMVVSQIVIA